MNLEFSSKELFLIAMLIIGVTFLYLVQSTSFLGEDEAFYISLAREFAKGQYSIINEFGNHNAISPFYPLLISFFSFLSSNLLTLAKTINIIFGMLTVLILYLITKKFNIFAGFTAMALVLAMPYFTQFMFLSYVEIPIAFFSILSLYLFLSLDSIKKAILLGVILGLSFYVKSSGIFLLISYFLYSLLTFLSKKSKELFKLTFISSIIAFLIFAPWIVRNIYLFNYPYVEGLNYIFPLPKEANPTWLTKEIATAISPTTDYIQIFGLFSIFFTITGFVYYFNTKQEKEKKVIEISISMSALFFIFYFVRTYIGGIEPRYLSIIFPQLALIGGIFLGDLNKSLMSKSKYLSIITIILIFYGLFLSYQVALGASQSVRYPEDYIQALTWIKQNTPKDSVIFTTYGGSVSYYAERKRIWNSLEEFPTIMTTQNSTYIYDTLKKYNVTHILIWKDVIAQNYIMPGSNILGLFTYNFVNTVLNNNQSFSIEYGNQNNVILELK